MSENSKPNQPNIRLNSRTKWRLTLIIFLIILGSIITVGILTESQIWMGPDLINLPYIVNGNITINAKTSLDYQFNIPPNFTDTSVWGRFTTLGGNSNDLKVYIVDNTNFNYHNSGQEFTALYQSGQTTNAPISANNLSRGTYYLVLDNEFSASQKTANIFAQTCPYF